MRVHDRFIKDSTTISDQAKPKDFTEDVKWDDWDPTFRAFLRLIPGVNDVPIIYVIRINEEPDPTPQDDYLEEYIRMAPLAGPAYVQDSQRVLTLLKKFVAGNERAESALQSLNSTSDGRGGYFAVKTSHEGEGIMQQKVQKAKTTIESLFYSGEKKPHMWWQKFEQEIVKDMQLLMEKREELYILTIRN